MNEAKPDFILWLASINKFIDYQEKSNTVDANSARKTASGYENLMIILTGISLLVAVIAGFIVTRSIVNPLKKVARDIDDSSNEIASVSEDILKSSNSLAKGSTSQASSIEEISTAIEQMNQIVRQNAEVSENASKLAVASRDSAKHGERVVQDMVGAIGEINDSNIQIMDQVNESNRQMTEIVNVIAEIENKTKVINDIVFQTKLLSFNASVEAARAGDHGKGFSVVAEEVGKLAQMSGDAAKEISDMLTNSSSKVESIVKETKSKVAILIDSGKEKIDTGNVVAKKCADVLQDIVVKVNSVTEMGTEISSSLKEQSEGFAQITQSIADMDKVTQENSILATENANTINSLNEQTVEMRKAYANLSELVGGKL